MAALGVGAVVGIGAPRFEIVQPHLGAPAILRPGDSLRIDLVSAWPFWRSELEIELEGPVQGHPLEVGRTTSSVLGLGRSAHVTLPLDLPARGFSLRVSGGGVSRVRPQAVRVVAEYPSRIRFVQLADLPFIGDRGRADAEMERIVDEINLIAPDYVLITGDLAYRATEAAYDQLVASLGRLEAPAIVAVGNHEYDRWSLFLRHFVRPRHVVDFGDYYVVSLNSAHRHGQVTHSQLRWMRRVMAERPGRIPIVQIHHPLFGGARVARMAPEIVEAMSAHASPIALFGHLHHDAVFDATGRTPESWSPNGAKFGATTSASEQNLRPGNDGTPSYAGYRLVRVNDGTLTSMTYDYDGNGERDPASSYPFGRVRVHHPEPFTAVITNALNEPLSRARVRTEIPGTVLGLQPDQGRLADVRPQGDSTVYITEIDLPAESTTVLRLREPLIR